MPIRHCLLILLSILTTQALMLPKAVDAKELSDDRADDRRKMVVQQITRRGIADAAVLRAMGSVPRHRFVPETLQSMAYCDQPLTIGHGQTISQPYIVALMSEVLDVRPGQRVLEIGTGSGYQAAVLAEMGVEVYSIEIIPELGKRAEEVLAALGYKEVCVKIGDGYQGWPEAAPFDGIIVTCSPTKIPEPLTAQLAEGGRLVIPVGDFFYQKLVLLTKKEGRLIEEKIEDVRFVPMVDGAGKKY